jgi:hypothetical protein
MRIIVACEESQAVTIELRKLGHEAFSCDVQECSGGYSNWHIQGDVICQLDKGWDMLIAFPPCTFLSAVQTHICRNDTDRVLKRIEAAKFFMTLMNCDIPKIAIENPAGVMTHIYRPADQVIQPYFFGDSEMKRTCLWLKNLPKLQHFISDDLFSNKSHVNKPNPSFTWINKNGKIKNEYYTYSKNAKDRSKTFLSIAKAMAKQWT